MILNIQDKTNSANILYYQSLVLLFLPCEKFSLSEDDRNILNVFAYEKQGIYYADVEIIIGDKKAKCHLCENVIEFFTPQMKNLIGRAFLEAAFDIFGFVPPWGISTGVKPVKLVKSIKSNYKFDDCKNILLDSYKLSLQKTELVLSVLDREEEIMSSLKDRSCSVYISIPFCPTRCDYCSFVSVATPKLLSLIPDYLVKLEKELQLIAEAIRINGLNLSSIYVGGGTPAILSEKQIQFLLAAIHKNFDFCFPEEFTFEAGRPDCITADKLKVLIDNDVDRISINTQTTNNEVLLKIKRNHTFRQYANAMEMAHSLGFRCINTDLIAGLPYECTQSFKKSVDDILKFSPHNVTVHSFSLKKSSTYRNSYNESFLENFKNSAEMIDYAYSKLTENSYMPYYVYRQKNSAGNLDNTGYSKVGFESIYNIVTMGEYHTVLAAGAGAVTKLVSKDIKTVKRVFSPKYPYEFLDDEKYKCFDIDRVSEFYKTEY